MDILSAVLYVLGVGVLNKFFYKPDQLTKFIILLWPITITYVIFLILEQNKDSQQNEELS